MSNASTWDAARFDRFERAGWAQRAAAYEGGFSALTARLIDPLLDAARVGPGMSVLDVGAGPGHVAAAAAVRGADVAAVDASPDMVALARKLHPELDARVGVLPGLPFPSGQFGAVVGNFVINHLGDPAAGVADLRRVLAGGGWLALSCWERAPMRATAVFDEAVAEAGVAVPQGLPASSMFLADAQDRASGFRDLLAAAGLARPSVTRVEWEHLVDPDAWWTQVVHGVPLTGAVISRLDEASRAAVKKVYDARVARYATGDGLVALPAVALIGTGCLRLPARCDLQALAQRRPGPVEHRSGGGHRDTHRRGHTLRGKPKPVLKKHRRPVPVRQARQRSNHGTAAPMPAASRSCPEWVRAR
jgi:SAM-dependent methyltransferase